MLQYCLRVCDLSVGSQQLRGLIPLLFENKTILIECMRFSTKICFRSMMVLLRTIWVMWVVNILGVGGAFEPAAAAAAVLLQQRHRHRHQHRQQLNVAFPYALIALFALVALCARCSLCARLARALARRSTRLRCATPSPSPPFLTLRNPLLSSRFRV
jgi:hypothetical protein